MRTVLHVVDDLPPHGGGMERAVWTLARRWADVGVRAVILTGRREGEAEEEERDGVAIVRATSSLWRLPGGRPRGGSLFFPPVGDPAVAAVAARVVAEHQVDLVHGHAWLLDACGGAFDDLPTVAGHHDASGICARKTLIDADGQACPGPSVARCLPCAGRRYGTVRGTAVAGMRLSTLRRARRRTHVAISTRVAGQLAANGIDATTVPTFIDEAVLAEAAEAERPEWLPDGRTILYAGQVSVHKGVDVLLDALPEIRRRTGDVTLVLAGAVQDDMVAAVAGAGEHVVVAGRRPHGEILGAMRHATAVMLPSRSEAFGQTAVEALAASAATAVGAPTGMTDIVYDGVHGLHVAAGDADATAEAAVRLLSGGADVAAMRAAGPGRAAEFTLEKVRPKLLAVYDTAYGGTFLG